MYSGEGSPTMAMSDMHIKVLEECRVMLVKDLDPDDVVDYLIADGILVPDDTDEIKSLQKRKEKVRLLLDVITRRGNKAFDSFMKALQDQDTGHHHLYKALIKKLQDTEQLEYGVQDREQLVPLPCLDTSTEMKHPIQCSSLGGGSIKSTDCTDAHPQRTSMQAQSSAEGYDIAEFTRDTPRSPNKIPTNKELGELASKLGKNWEQLAVRLELSDSDTYRCKVENQHNVWSQIYSALVLWRNKKYKNATIGALVKELKFCEFGHEVYAFLMEA